ncbi:uncharacterized protein [Cardiocondyla obscurior]|uniref:uncharacterized protein isoform X3 n=1 Tax=Cardiocondyla obscurior TaxID=286306 RepID=UPI0039657E99
MYTAVDGMAMRHIFRKLWDNIRPAMYTSGILIAHCTSCDKPGENDKLNLTSPDVNKLTLGLSMEYRTLLNELISLLEVTVIRAVSDEHWDLIVTVRNEMQDTKEKITRLTTYMDYAHKMVISSAELCYMCGMDNLTDTLQQRIEDALNRVKEENDSNAKLERTYWRIQERCIKDTNKKTEEQ